VNDAEKFKGERHKLGPIKACVPEWAVYNTCPYSHIYGLAEEDVGEVSRCQEIMTQVPKS